MKPFLSFRIALLLAVALLVCANYCGSTSAILLSAPTKNHQIVENNGGPWIVTNAMIDGDIDEAMPLKQGKDDAFSSINHTAWARIDNVTQCTPENGVTCRIKAVVTGEGDGYEVVAYERRATLVYSVNSNASQAVFMTETSHGEWSAIIPAQPSGAHVDFYIRVADNFGNVTTGALFRSGNRIRFSAGIPDIDNSKDIVPADLDLLAFSASFDSEYLYVTFNVEGTISTGTTDPPFVHMYTINFVEPFVPLKSWDFIAGYNWVYVPLEAEMDNYLLDYIFYDPMSIFDKVDADIFDSTGMYVLNGRRYKGGNIADIFFSVEAAPESIVTGNTFFGRIRRDGLSMVNSDYVRIVVSTAASNSLESFMPIPYNCSHFLTLDLHNYGYTVP